MSTELPDDRLSARRGDFDVQTIGATFSHRLSESGSLRLGYDLQESTFEGLHHARVPHPQPQHRGGLSQAVVELAPDIPALHHRVGHHRREYRLYHPRGAAWLSQLRRGRRAPHPGDGVCFDSAPDGPHVECPGAISARGRVSRRIGSPGLRHSANASLGGLAPRIDLYINANYVTGTSGLSGSGPRFDSFSAVGARAPALSEALPRIAIPLLITTTSPRWSIGPPVCHRSSVAAECGWA